MRSIVINLPDAADRLEAFFSRELATGLRSEVFPAVHGASLSPRPDRLNGITDGEVGCHLSHLGVLRAVAGDGEGWSTVLEDDVLFWDGFGDNLAAAAVAADLMGFDIVQLGWVPLTKAPDQFQLTRARLAAAPTTRRAARIFRKDLQLQAPALVDAPWGWGAHCYMVRERFASVVADFIDGPRVLAPVDHLFALLPRLFPGRVGRARFSLAGQMPEDASSVNEDRGMRAFQTDATGRVIWS